MKTKVVFCFLGINHRPDVVCSLLDVCLEAAKAYSSHIEASFLDATRNSISFPSHISYVRLIPKPHQAVTAFFTSSNSGCSESTFPQPNPTLIPPIFLQISDYYYISHYLPSDCLVFRLRPDVLISARAVCQFFEYVLHYSSLDNPLPALLPASSVDFPFYFPDYCFLIPCGFLRSLSSTALSFEYLSLYPLPALPMHIWAPHLLSSSPELNKLFHKSILASGPFLQLYYSLRILYHPQYTELVSSSYAFCLDDSTLPVLYSSWLSAHNQNRGLRILTISRLRNFFLHPFVIATLSRFLIPRFSLRIPLQSSLPGLRPVLLPLSLLPSLCFAFYDLSCFIYFNYVRPRGFRK